MYEDMTPERIRNRILGRLKTDLQTREGIRTILGVSVLKVVENIFEHNDGPVFGRSQNENPPENGGEEEHFYDESV